MPRLPLSLLPPALSLSEAACAFPVLDAYRVHVGNGVESRDGVCGDGRETLLKGTGWSVHGAGLGEVQGNQRFQG